MAKIQKIPFLSNGTFQNGMAQSEEVVDGLHEQSRLFNEADKVVGVVHLAVAVGDSGEIETDLREAERGGVETLAVPERLHDVKVRVGGHHLGGTTKDAHNLLLTETVEELTHPDGVKKLVTRQFAAVVEHVGSIPVDTIGTSI